MIYTKYEYIELIILQQDSNYYNPVVGTTMYVICVRSYPFMVVKITR